MIYLSRARLHRPRANLVQTLRMVTAFERNDIHVTLYLPPWKVDMPLAERLAEFGLDRAVDLRASRLLHSSLKLWPFVLVHRVALLAADVVYVRSVALSEALAGCDVPHVLEVHEAQKLALEGRLDRVVARQRRGLIRHLLPISRAAAQTLIEAGADPARVHVAPSGVEVSEFTSIPLPEAASLANPQVVYVGSVSRSRGLDVLATLAGRGIADVTLVGNVEDQLPQIPRLRSVGRVPHRDVPAWYARGNVAVMPYQASLGHADSISPMKLFEAMAAGRPVVASDLPPIRELLEDGCDGLLVPPTDLDAWVEAVSRLRAEPALALRMARMAREKVAAYGWDRRARAIAEACGWSVSASRP